MFIPLGSEAPLRYKPIGTICLIVVNLLAFYVQIAVDELSIASSIGGSSASVWGSDVKHGTLGIQPRQQRELTQEEVEELLRAIEEEQIRFPAWWGYALSTGDGLHPIQWFTAFFMHAGIGHLVGNMIFLWTFGMVVEGRLGTFKFLIFYCSVGVFQNMCVQILFLGAPVPRAALGASGAIYGIMVAAALWSPKENIVCILIVIVRVFFPRIPILLFVAFYVLWDLGLTLLVNFNLSTPVLHIIGAATGFVAASIALKKSWVDCEFEDVVSMAIDASGRDPRKLKADKIKAQQDREHAASESASLAKMNRDSEKVDWLWTQIDQALRGQQPEQAVQHWNELRKIQFDAVWPEERLIKLISQLQHQRKWELVIPYSQTYLNLYRDHRAQIQINLAKIYLLKKNLPRKTIRLIGEIKKNEELSEQQLREAEAIEKKASDAIEEEDFFS